MNDKMQAGEYSVWLNAFIQTMKGENDGSVPCGDCVACCTASKFIHVRPSDTQALATIPQEILFQAPGLPDGHFLLGYDREGRCPMFIDGSCSIYRYRPETCRQYDCRVFAASGVSMTGESPDIARKVSSWEFEYSNPDSVVLSDALQMAGRFLVEYRGKFPDGFLPNTDSQLAVLAVRVHRVFIGRTLESVREDYRRVIDSIISNVL